MKIDVDKFIEWLRGEEEGCKQIIQKEKSDDNFLACQEQLDYQTIFGYIIFHITECADEHDWIEKE